MFFDPNEWCMNATGDMLFNTKTYKTIRKRVWHDNTKTDKEGDFFYFSFHELNASQAVAFLFSSEEDAKLVHPGSCGNNWNFDMVDYQMWNELNLDFMNGISDPRSDYQYCDTEN